MIRRAVQVLIAVAVTACGNEIRTVPVVDAGMLLPRTVCLDNDGDGYAGTGDCAAEPQVDCNDKDPLTYPGAPEQCNAVDDNCNAEIDEGLPVVAYYRDEDGDGFGAMKVGEGCKAPPMGSVTQPGDCDDASTAIRPGQAEICNGIDEDCDGTPDNGLPFQDFYLDEDGDGFGSSIAMPVSACETAVAGRVTNSGDCNDQNPNLKPGAVELCNRLDDNCDGQLDNGIPYKNYFVDVDGDGFGDATAQAELSCAPLAGKVENNTDCNDALASVRPGAPELCNGVDDDCDTQRDEGLSFVSYYPDLDGDGFGAAGASAQSSCAPVAGKVTNSGDCDDASTAVKPGAVERCNGVDDNCSGAADEGLTFVSYYPDVDGDGFGAAGATAISACEPVVGRVTNDQDCNDTTNAVKPGATEACNGVDDDCSGSADEGLTFVDYYPDGDGDGHGSATAAAQRSCTPIAGRVTNRTDCNDANAGISPDGVETCNGLDDNCSGAADEALPTQSYFPDGDGDGVGRQGATAVVSCGPVANHVLTNTDCNDANASVRPGAAELCNNVDDNCDTEIDNGVATQDYYVDVDGDGFGATGSVAQADCAPVPGRVTNSLDCNDQDATVKPTAAEVCNDKDDDCDLQTDEGLTRLSYYPDVDGDTYGAMGVSAQLSCRPVTGKVANSSDCDDANLAVRPGATETCNGRDDDCDTFIDDGLATQSYFVDGDTDGFGAAGSSAIVSCSAVSGRVTNNTDCNDANSAIKPTAAETCNGVDDNCAGGIDEGNPGGGAACSTGQSGVCGPGTLRCVSASVSCVRNVAPGTESCNSLDDDCDGVTDDGFTGLGQACTAGVGACARQGTNVCNGAGTGVVCSATPGAPSPPSCDGIDNDCDGVTDEPLLTSTVGLSTTAFSDLEVEPLYYSAASCQGGATGSGTDALAGGAVLMGAGTSGIRLQPLLASGELQPDAGAISVSTYTYADVDFAQAGDGYLVAGVFAPYPEIDLYYVDRSGNHRATDLSEFAPPSGQAIDSLRVVRGSGRRVSLLWRESDAGIKLAQVEACDAGAGLGWAIRPPGCGTGSHTASLVVPGPTLEPGLAVDSNHVDWAASQTCSAGPRRLAVSWIESSTNLRFLQLDENGANRVDGGVVAAVTAPRSLHSPDLSYFRNDAGADKHFVAFLAREPSTTPPQADLYYCQPGAGGYCSYAWEAYATQNGVDSLSRPRTSATASAVWLSAVRHVADATQWKRQVMTRTVAFDGLPTPPTADVELPVTSGACSGDAACRPGDKAGVTLWAPFGKLFYGASGATPSGSFSSTLTCN